MIKIYRLNPMPKEMGSFENGILKMNNQDPIEITEEEVIRRFNRGYWRCGEV